MGIRRILWEVTMGIWYKEWYITTPTGEEQMRAAITDPVDGAANREDISKRLDEIRQIPEERCAISLDQKRFLERVLAS